MGLKNVKLMVGGLVIGLAGCGTTGQVTTPPPDPLYSNTWVASEILGAESINDKSGTLTISPDGRIAGVAGCNTYRGSAIVRDGTFSVDAVGVTKIACVPALLAQEQQFLRALVTAERYELKGRNRLVLYSNISGSPTVFQAQ